MLKINTEKIFFFGKLTNIFHSVVNFAWSLSYTHFSDAMRGVHKTQNVGDTASVEWDLFCNVYSCVRRHVNFYMHILKLAIIKKISFSLFWMWCIIFYPRAKISMSIWARYLLIVASHTHTPAMTLISL